MAVGCREDARKTSRLIYLFYIRNGIHVLVKPLERLAEQGINVDWYDYWLNGHKDPDPTKVEQYKSWDAMKAFVAEQRRNIQTPEESIEACVFAIVTPPYGAIQSPFRKIHTSET